MFVIVYSIVYVRDVNEVMGGYGWIYSWLSFFRGEFYLNNFGEINLF